MTDRLAGKVAPITGGASGLGANAAALMVQEGAKVVVAEVKQRLAELAKTLPAGTRLETVYDRSALVNRAVHTVSKALLEAVALVAVLLVLFLGHVRAAVTVAVEPASTALVVAVANVTPEGPRRSTISNDGDAAAHDSGQPVNSIDAPRPVWICHNGPTGRESTARAIRRPDRCQRPEPRSHATQRGSWPTQPRR